MNKIVFLSVSFITFCFNSIAQLNFEYSDAITVKNGSDNFSLAWAGGLNYAQFSDFDFDFDGDLDLFVFDRSSDNISVFLQEEIAGNKFYKVKYNAHLSFPSDLRYRATMVDYNNDGKKDLFGYGIGGISVYKNVGNTISGLQWELEKEWLMTNSSGSLMNLFVSSADIPAIVDVDFDGDIDVLTFHIGGQHLQYHQNQSMENYGVPDSLEFVLKNECWGLFREDLNNSFVYLNDNSAPCTTENVPNPQLPENPLNNKSKPGDIHQKHSGSTVLALDIDNSGVLDLILGDVSFPSVTLLTNGGSAPNTNSAIVSQDNSFPNNTTPLNLTLFPASFYLDVDFDNVKDLIFCPNAKNISENEKSVWFYKNTGTNANPTFQFQTSSFLQNEMIENGTGSIPVLADIDNDGLEDLFVANFYRYKNVLDKESSITFYKNTGTPSNPVFTYIDNDFLNLSSSSLGLRMVPTFGDLDNDGDKDMILGLDNGNLAFFENNSVFPAINFSAPVLNYQDNNGNPINTGQYASPQLFDLDKDNLLDLVIGNKTGEIKFYKNIGTISNPAFQLTNDTLGNIDIATASPDGYAIPHFFRKNDTTFLFLGGIEGKLRFYDHIDDSLSNGESFNLHSDHFLGIDMGAYSSFFVKDIDNDNFLNMFSGQDLGGLYHFEVDPNSQSGISELEEDPEFLIYPNPSNGIFTVISASTEEFTLEVLDLLGNVVFQKENVSINTTFNVSERATGVYLVLIANSQGDRKTYRIVKTN